MDLRLLESNSASLPSLPDGIFYGQYESHDYINKKIYERILADNPVKPTIDIRSLPTRNVLYPAMDNREIYNPRDYAKFDPKNSFAPIQAKGPFEGYKVKDESQLRNQYFALQRGAEQAVYVPSSNSDLYKVTVPESGDALQQPYPNLFYVPKMTTELPPNQDVIGRNMFFNHTKFQVQDVMPVLFE